MGAHNTFQTIYNIMFYIYDIYRFLIESIVLVVFFGKLNAACVKTVSFRFEGSHEYNSLDILSMFIPIMQRWRGDHSRQVFGELHLNERSAFPGFCR